MFALSSQILLHKYYLFCLMVTVDRLNLISPMQLNLMRYRLGELYEHAHRIACH